MIRSENTPMHAPQQLANEVITGTHAIGINSNGAKLALRRAADR